jgi:trigger factor
MQVTREELNPCTVQLSVVCDSEQVKAGFEKAFKQFTKNIKLPGFRPGHAPRSMLESLVTERDLIDDAADNLFRNTYSAIIKQENLEPDLTTRPQVEITKLDRGTLTGEYVVKVPLPPKIELGDYKSLPVEKASSEVTEAEIDAQIDEFRKGRGKYESITDRGAMTGDYAVVSIKADDTEGDGRNFMVVVGQTKFPALDDALLEMKVEEMKSLDLTFPEEFQDKEWAGQTKHAQITLNSLSAVRLPAVDDEFAQSLQTENVETLRSRLRELIGQAKIQMSRDLMVEKLLDELHARSVINVSDNMWEDLANRRLAEQAEDQRKENKTLEAYAAENGMSLEELVNAWREKAKLHVERALMIREIFTKEEMQLTNQELNQELFSMASEYNTEPEEMLKLLQQNKALEELHYRSISRKVSDYLLSHAEILEPGSAPAAPAAEASTDAAPAEEATAKPKAKSKAKAKA